MYCIRYQKFHNFKCHCMSKSSERRAREKYRRRFSLDIKYRNKFTYSEKKREKVF